MLQDGPACAKDARLKKGAPLTNKIAILAAAALAATGGAANAQTPTAGNPLVDRVVECRAMPDVPARVRCYDEAVDALAKATASGDVVVVDKEDVRKTRRSLFGFSLPKLPLFRGDSTAEEEAPDEIEAKIATVRGLGYGKYLIVLDSGARWQTTEPPRGATPDPRPGEAIKISRGALGAYFISVDGRRAVKGMRVG